MLLGTPFHPRTSALNESHSWRRWSGYLSAGSYELTHEREYWAIRNAAALIDVTPLFKYRISGPEAVRLLNRVVTRDVSKLAPGQVAYTPWCDDDGKVIDDGTVTRLDAQTFRLTAAEPSLLWLSDAAFRLNVQIEDVSDTVASLALQGPRSREILNGVCGASVDGLRYFRAMDNTVRGRPLTISRTGYTGDLGYEVWMEPQNAVAVWDALMEAGFGYGLTPTGILALDVARVEAGLIMLDVDYTSAHKAVIEEQKSSPLELGLARLVNFEKGNFIGRAALLKEKARGPAWQLVGVEVDWPALERLYTEVGLPPQLPLTTSRASVPLFAGGRQIGYASSQCWSPLLKKYIALAHIESAHAKPGTLCTFEITVQHKRKWAAARVAALPFFEPERKKR